MKGYETLPGASYDSLIGGAEIPLFNRNVLVSSDTTLERGMLLYGTGLGSDTTVQPVTATNPTWGIPLFIAAEDCSGETRTTVFTNGRFNRSAIKLSEGVQLEPYELEMKSQGLYLTEAI